MTELNSKGESNRARAIERLAAKLYDTESAGGKSWLMLGWNIRQPWMNKARQQFQETGSPFGIPGLWRALRSMLSGERS